MGKGEGEKEQTVWIVDKTFNELSTVRGERRAEKGGGGKIETRVSMLSCSEGIWMCSEEGGVCWLYYSFILII